MPRKRKSRFLTVYTVSYGEFNMKSGMTHTVAGSYLFRGDAIRECADVLINELCLCHELRKSFLGDKDHDIKGVLVRENVPAEDVEMFFENECPTRIKIPDSIKRAISPYIRDVIGSDACYKVKSFTFSQGSEVMEFAFDIDENDVECMDGLQLWTCITSGTDSDGHDPEWEQPFPEIFFAEDDAVECAIDDLRQCLDGYERYEKKEILDEAREDLDEKGYYEFDLNDTTSRRWDIWSTPIDIGQGARKIQRH